MPTNTLKVLAMHIAPGQEDRIVEIESFAEGSRFSDSVAGLTTNKVFVLGPRAHIETLLRIVVRHSYGQGRDYYVWGFESRSDADLFVRTVEAIGHLSYWQVGVSSEGYSCIAEFPLLGYFCCWPIRRGQVVDYMFGTELIRSDFATLLKDLPNNRAQAIVIVDPAVIQQQPLVLPEDVQPIIVLDEEKSKPITLDVKPTAEDLVYNPAQREGILTRNGGTLHYWLFGKVEESRKFFAEAASRGIGMGWHFAKVH
jgi:hypothetical protein